LDKRNEFTFYNLSNKTKSNNISMIFPDWQGSNENIMIFSPHDDDALLGAGYLIKAAQFFEGQVYITIFNDGSTGYSRPELKNKIKKIRENESINAFSKIGITSENITRFNIPDFSGLQFLGWQDMHGNEGNFKKIVKLLRKLKITRLIMANGYMEHHDHTAVYISGIFDGVQAGDPIKIDWGEPSKIKTFLVYSVWGKFSPEDAILNKRDTSIRGNLAISVKENIEKEIQVAISQFKSQSDIIDVLTNIRKERKTTDNKYLEVYLKMDPRPRFNSKPYIQLITEIEANERNE